MATAKEMLWNVRYTVLANGWESTRQVQAETEKKALELFVEYWERDGSSIDELSSYGIQGGPMSIEV